MWRSPSEDESARSAQEVGGGEELSSGVSVYIWKGTVVGVIWPIGSGKSTFLRALKRH